MCIRNVYIRIAGTVKVVIMLVKQLFFVCLDKLIYLCIHYVITISKIVLHK